MSEADSDLRQIEDRHKLDATWFTGGLHDSNSYVTMAHKDRGELLERLRALRTGKFMLDQDSSLMVIPTAAVLWLLGDGPDENGDHFGESPISARRAQYWWRTTFRRMCGL